MAGISEERVIQLIKQVLKASGKDLNQLDTFPRDPVDEDIIGIYNVGTSKLNKITRKNFLKNITGGGGGTGVLAKTITVSLADGKRWGTIKDGDVINAGTKYDDILTRALVETKFPTYSPAGISVSMSAPADGEIGESVSNSITGSFAQNDAGASTGIRLYRGAQVVIGSATSSPITRVEQMVRTASPIPVYAVADYQAGPKKNIQPAGTPDTRPAQVRNPNAPQAAETGFQSNVLYLNGFLLLFYGPVASLSSASTQVRSLSSARSDQTSQFILNTGTAQRIFEVDLPPGKVISQVVDLDNLNQVITGDYVNTGSVSVANGSGYQPDGTTPKNPVTYSRYAKTQAVPYTNNHRHQITIANG